VSFEPAGGAEFARCHLQEHPDAATPLAQALLTAGRPEAALRLLETHGDVQADPLGIVLLALVLGVEREVEINLPPGQAGRQLRSWLESLWASGRPDLRDALCERSAALEPAFPWLEPWLAARVAALSSSRR